jgi:hypothetical protein
VTDRGTAVVQGYVIEDDDTLARLDLPVGEAAVEVPLALLRAAAQEVDGG